MAGLLATSAGINYKLPINGNEAGKYQDFLKGLVTAEGRYVEQRREEWDFNEFDNLEQVICDFINCCQSGECIQNKMISTVVNKMLMEMNRI